MPRRRGSYKEPKTKIDPRYQSRQLERFVNKVMLQGKKDTARKIVYGALEGAQKELDAEPVDILNQALANIRPDQEVRSRRVGGATYQVPMPVRRKRGFSLAMRWIVKAARSQSGSMQDNLQREIIAAYRNEGSAVKKKEHIHQMAESNKAFSHFRW